MRVINGMLLPLSNISEHRMASISDSSHNRSRISRSAPDDINSSQQKRLVVMFHLQSFNIKSFTVVLTK